VIPLCRMLALESNAKYLLVASEDASSVAGTARLRFCGTAEAAVSTLPELCLSLMMHICR
jgi:hypothetical protein